MYRCIMGGVHEHSRDLSLKYPQGQGFIAAASMKRAGKTERHRSPRNGHGTVFQRLPHHFQNVAGETPAVRPETGLHDAPAIPHRDAGRCHHQSGPASEIVWCGDAERTLRHQTRPPRRARRPPSESWWSPVLPRVAAAQGSMGGSLLASIVLPEPGGPIIRMLWPPAAATSSARLAV